MVEVNTLLQVQGSVQHDAKEHKPRCHVKKVILDLLMGSVGGRYRYKFVRVSTTLSDKQERVVPNKLPLRVGVYRQGTTKIREEREEMEQQLTLCLILSPTFRRRGPTTSNSKGLSCLVFSLRTCCGSRLRGVWGANGSVGGLTWGA